MNTATVTANIGPGNTVTAKVLNNVSKIYFDFDAATVNIEHQETGEERKISHFQYSNIATVSFSISGDDTAVTIST